MHIERFTVDLTTDGSGNATGYTPVLTGRVLALHYVKDGSNAFSDGVDFAVTAEATGETIWAENDVNATAHRYPRAATHNADGTAALYAADGQAVNEAVALASDRVQIAVSSGGAAKAGKVLVVIG